MRSPPVFLDQSPPKPINRGVPVQFVALENIIVPESAAALSDGFRFWRGHGYSVARMIPRLRELVPQWLAEGRIEVTKWQEGELPPPPLPKPFTPQSRPGSQLRRFLKPRKLWAAIKRRLGL